MSKALDIALPTSPEAVLAFSPITATWYMLRMWTQTCWGFPDKQKRARKYFEERIWMEQNTDVAYSYSPPSDEEEVLEYVKEGDQTIFIAATGLFEEKWDIRPLNLEATKKFGYGS